MAEIIAVAMNKGGVGKTTLITNLASAVALTGKKVLLIDTDAQGNSSMAFGLNPITFENTMYDIFVGDKKMSEVRVSICDGLLDFIPSNTDSDFLEFDILTNIHKYGDVQNLFKNALDEIKDEYDYVFVDTPPALGLIAGNVLSIADKVVIPFVPEDYAVQGLIKVIETVKRFKDKRNANLKIAGVVGMMIDKRTKLHGQRLDNAEAYCFSQGITLCNTIISRTIEYANATAYSKRPSVMVKAEGNPYIDLMGELINGKKQ